MTAARAHTSARTGPFGGGPALQGSGQYHHTLRFWRRCPDRGGTTQRRCQVLDRPDRHVSDVMRRDFIVVSPEETLEKLVDEQILGKGKRGLIVEQNDRVIGLLTFILSKQFQVPTGLPPQLPR